MTDVHNTNATIRVQGASGIGKEAISLVIREALLNAGYILTPHDCCQGEDTFRIVKPRETSIHIAKTRKF